MKMQKILFMAFILSHCMQILGDVPLNESDYTKYKTERTDLWHKTEYYRWCEGGTCQCPLIRTYTDTDNIQNFDGDVVTRIYEHYKCQ